MVMDLIVILWITVWLMYWSWENKRHLQDVRDLRVRVFELEHDICMMEKNIRELGDDLIAIANTITKEGK